MLMEFKTIDLYQYFLHPKFNEKTIFTKFQKVLNSNEKFCREQKVFGKKMSTSCSLISVSKEIRENLDKGMKGSSVFLGLAKAFDTVKHGLVVQNLESYGLRRQAAKNN